MNEAAWEEYCMALEADEEWNKNMKWWTTIGGTDTLTQQEVDRNTDRTYQILEGVGKGLCLLLR